MNKKRVIAAVALALLLAVVALLANPSLLKSLKRDSNKGAATQAQDQPSGHAGHGAGAPPPQTEPKETQEGDQETATVEIPQEKQQLIGVKTAVASVKPLRKVIRTVGRIEYDERKLATINTKIEGWIERLHVNYTGTYVRKGEPVAEVYSPELYATQQEFLNVLRWTDKKESDNHKQDRYYGKTTELSGLLGKDAQAMANAARQRLKLWDISDAQIRRIEETGKPERTLTIYSPVNGYVVQKTAIQGMKMMPGEKLFDIADLSTVWVVSDIYEYELPVVSTGQSAVISLSYFPGKEFTSKIDYIYPTLAGETRTAKARFTVPNPGGKLKPQMFTDVEIKVSLGSRLAVPEEAVLNTGTRQIVYVDKGEGLFEPRDVTTGLKAEGMVEIVKGLKAGEKVASEANFLIDSEARLKGIVQ